MKKLFSYTFVQLQFFFFVNWKFEVWGEWEMFLYLDY